MLINRALQEGGVMTNQSPTQPVREKSYAVGRSYDTMSGRVITMTTCSDSSDVTMKTTLRQNAETGVVREEPLITIHEVKTPTSPVEPAVSICEQAGEMTRTLDIKGGVVSMTSTQHPFQPPELPVDELKLSPTPGRKSPYLVRVVCWQAWKQAWWENSSHLHSCTAPKLDVGLFDLVQTEHNSLEKLQEWWRCAAAVSTEGAVCSCSVQFKFFSASPFFLSQMLLCSSSSDQNGEGGFFLYFFLVFYQSSQQLDFHSVSPSSTCFTGSTFFDWLLWFCGLFYVVWSCDHQCFIKSPGSSCKLTTISVIIFTNNHDTELKDKINTVSRTKRLLWFDERFIQVRSKYVPTD